MTGLTLALAVTAAVIVGTAAVVAVGLLIDRSAARHDDANGPYGGSGFSRTSDVRQARGGR